MTISNAIKAALRNVARHGDTDIFPFPFENLIFSDQLDESKAVLDKIHHDFSKWLVNYPPQTISGLTMVGYTGFRWATQIDPFWNAYFLALVISIADQIEAQRVSENEKVVFSYRFAWNKTDAKLFKDSTWLDYRKRCVELSKTCSIVVQTDIADFYPRIYHHRIENALNRLPTPGDAPKKIMEMLGCFSKNVSYGIPVGGPASRILAELALDGVDKLLFTKGVKFCRYADDYTFFCTDKAEAYRNLVFLAEKLANEGLVLQKKKTRIMSAEEFQQTAKLLDPIEADSLIASDEQKLLNISLRFDPYSPTAIEDYDELKAAVTQVDIIGILGREVAKTNIDAAVSKQAVKAIKALSANQQEDALTMLLEEENLMTLAPVFITVMRVVKDIYPDLRQTFQSQVDNILCDLYAKQSPLLSVEVNLAYFIQALAGRQTQRKEEMLVKLFEDTVNPMVRRLIIFAMSKWGCHYWLSDVKNRYGGMSVFERRSFMIASYFLGDEGRHWREFTKSSWKEPEMLVRDWFSKRFQTNRSVPI